MNRRILLIGLFLVATALLSAGGDIEEPKEEVPVVQVTGVVRLVGNEPFTELIISAPNSSWFVPKEERAKLNDLQHRIVTVEGEEVVKDMKFANGRSAGKRRELRNINIIEVQE